MACVLHFALYAYFTPNEAIIFNFVFMQIFLVCQIQLIENNWTVGFLVKKEMLNNEYLLLINYCFLVYI